MAPADEDLGAVLLKSMWVGMAAVSATMVTRYYVRARLVAKIAPDDWIMLLAYVRSQFIHWKSDQPGAGSYSDRKRIRYRRRSLWIWATSVAA